MTKLIIAPPTGISYKVKPTNRSKSKSSYKKGKRIKRKPRSYSYSSYNPYSEDGLSKSNKSTKKKVSSKSAKGINARVHASESPMEAEIRKFLTSLNIKFHQEKTFPSLINPATNHYLFFDFYLPQYNLLLEYDGKHHFESDDKEHLANVKARDAYKNGWAKRNGFKLLRFNSRNLKSMKETILNSTILKDSRN